MRWRRPIAALATLPLALLVLSARSGVTQADSAGPTINLWYGTNQSFGQLGNPQQWVNILGNVLDADGVASLKYSLNGGPAVNLTIGPDNRRLAEPGDFNIDLDRTALLNGLNQVVITATDTLGNSSAATVMVQYVGGNVWPLPYTINWAAGIQNVAQIVDGQWSLQAGNLSPDVMAYDRLVAVGDETWTNYEVTVPVTVTEVGVPGPNSSSPGLGVVARWRGHTDSPAICAQPHCGWLPWGAAAWYTWGSNAYLLLGDTSTLVRDTTGRTLSLGTPYMWKVRVETTPGGRSYYRFKFWEQGQPEPAAWDLSTVGEPTDLTSGSALLVAHHVDAAFGNMTFTAGPFNDDTAAPAVSNILTTTAPFSATITWKTSKEPGDSRVDFGLTTAYGSFVTDSNLVHQHAITLTGLSPDTEYHFKITSADAWGNSGITGDHWFRTASGMKVFLPVLYKLEP